jgi:hypothetical protein
LRLPYQIRHRINPQIGQPVAARRADWVKVDGEWKTEDGRFKVVDDPRFGLLIAEIKNVAYGMGMVME